MAESIETDFSALQADIQQLRTDFAKMATDMRNIAANGYSQASGKAQESAEKAWGEMRRQVENVGQEIEERPFASALVSFATGLVLGMLLNARRG
jgi:ElaB/YqjD/DUF883 family membrane-anchored ribosome-binding protein